MGEQQRFNSVLDAQPLLHQILALTVNTLGILFLGRWHPYHAAALAITPEISREHAQHPYRIEPVRLGSSGTAVDEDAGGLEYIVGDAMRCKQTVQPEPVTTGLKAADNLNRSVEPASNTGAQGRN